MTAAILTFVATLLGFAVWLWKRKLQQRDDPRLAALRRHDEIHRQIATGDAAGTNLSLDRDLQRLRLAKALRRHRQRSGGAPDERR